MIMVIENDYIYLCKFGSNFQVKNYEMDEN